MKQEMYTVFIYHYAELTHLILAKDKEDLSVNNQHSSPLDIEIFIRLLMNLPSYLILHGHAIKWEGFPHVVPLCVNIFTAESKWFATQSSHFNDMDTSNPISTLLTDFLSLSTKFNNNTCMAMANAHVQTKPMCLTISPIVCNQYIQSWWYLNTNVEWYLIDTYLMIILVFLVPYG